MEIYKTDILEIYILRVLIFNELQSRNTNFPKFWHGTFMQKPAKKAEMLTPATPPTHQSSLFSALLKTRVVIMPTLSSLAAKLAVVMTNWGDTNVSKLAQWRLTVLRVLEISQYGRDAFSYTYMYIHVSIIMAKQATNQSIRYKIMGHLRDVSKQCILFAFQNNYLI